MTAPTTTPGRFHRSRTSWSFAQHRLPWNEGCARVLRRHHDLGVGMAALAEITNTSGPAMVDTIGKNTLPGQDRPPTDDLLFESDPAILAGVLHGDRTTVMVGPPTRRYRPTSNPTLSVALRRLVIREFPRLLARIAQLDQSARAAALLRVLIVAPSTAYPDVAAAITDATVVAVDHAPPDVAAGALGWLALLHAVHGGHDRALAFSDRQLDLVTRSDHGGVDPAAVPHARWCRAALLAAMARHADAVREHTGLAADLREMERRLGSPDEARYDYGLLFARNHAALGARLLSADDAGTAVDHLQGAVRRYEYLLRRLEFFPLDADVLAYELATVHYALGHARHLIDPGSGSGDWAAAAHHLQDTRPPDDLVHAHGDNATLLDDLHAALHDRILPFTLRPRRLPLPRLPRSLVDQDLLDDGALWSAPLAPTPGAPDLPHLH